MSVNASAVMSNVVICTSPEATLQEAVKILAEKNISGLPVVDENNKVVGIISEKDIVEYSSKLHAIPLIAFSSWVSPYTDVSSIASFKQGFELLSSTRVKKIMSKRVITVNKDTPGNEIAKTMKKRNINRVPVVDENGELAGIITRTDLVNYLAGVGE